MLYSWFDNDQWLIGHSWSQQITDQSQLINHDHYQYNWLITTNNWLITTYQQWSHIITYWSRSVVIHQLFVVIYHLFLVIWIDQPWLIQFLWWSAVINQSFVVIRIDHDHACVICSDLINQLFSVSVLYWSIIYYWS